MHIEKTLRVTRLCRQHKNQCKYHPNCVKYAWRPPRSITEAVGYWKCMIVYDLCRAAEAISIRQDLIAKVSTKRRVHVRWSHSQGHAALSHHPWLFTGSSIDLRIKLLCACIKGTSGQVSVGLVLRNEWLHLQLNYRHIVPWSQRGRKLALGLKLMRSEDVSWMNAFHLLLYRVR